MATERRPALTYYLSEADSAAWQQGGTALAQVQARLWAAYQQAGFTEPLVVLHRTGEPAMVVDPHPALATPLTLAAPLAALAPSPGQAVAPRQVALGEALDLSAPRPPPGEPTYLLTLQASLAWARGGLDAQRVEQDLTYLHTRHAPDVPHAMVLLHDGTPAFELGSARLLRTLTQELEALQSRVEARTEARVHARQQVREMGG